MWLFVPAGVAILCGCGGASEPRPGAEPPAQRIVSLAPHLTELAYSAGAGAKLVGAVEHSNYPSAARALPRIGDAFRFDFERIATLEPDLVLAWRTGTPVQAIERLDALGFRTEVVGTARLVDIAAALRRIGVLAGTEAAAERAAADFENALASLVERNAGAREVSVFYQISLEPLFTVNDQHLISELLRACGGRNVFADAGDLAPVVGIEAVLARDPEVIIAAREGGAEELEFWRRWQDLAAVRGNNLFAVDADLVARATTRSLAGAGEICRVLEQARRKPAPGAGPSRSARTPQPPAALIDDPVSRALPGPARDGPARGR